MIAMQDSEIYASAKTKNQLAVFTYLTSTIFVDYWFFAPYILLVFYYYYAQKILSWHLA